MSTWVIPHERRHKPPEPKPDAQVAEATNRFYERELLDTRNPLRAATDWIVARRPHTLKEID